MIGVKVSVIVPVYGVAKYIERCATSLFEQTMSEGIEFIFVDDASPDDSITILKNILLKYPLRKDQVKILHHERNRGLAAARNTGLKASAGEYVIHCDSDDWVEPQMYETLYNTAIDTKADMVICDYYIDFSGGKKINVIQNIPSNTRLVTKMLIRGTIHNNVWSKLIKRSVYAGLSYAFEEGVDMWEDVSVISRLSYFCDNIYHIAVPLYHYAQYNPEAYTHKWKESYSKGILKVIDINATFFADKDIDIYPLIQRAYYSLLSHSGSDWRPQLLTQFNSEKGNRKIDYSIFSAFAKVHACCLFHSHNFLADLLMKIKNHRK